MGHMEIFSDQNIDRMVTQVRDVIRGAKKKVGRPGSRESVVLP